MRQECPAMRRMTSYVYKMHVYVIMYSLFGWLICYSTARSEYWSALTELVKEIA